MPYYRRSRSMQIDSTGAATFVAQRIEEEAVRLQQPLNDEERILLTHLPDASCVAWAVDAETPLLRPRDLPFEKLCRLTSVAIHQDLSCDPGTIVKWRLVAALLRADRHPMAWLLEWGGLEPRRPWWDKWLLLATGLVFVSCALGALWLAGNHSSPLTWATLGCGYVLAVLLLNVALKKLERWQLNRTISGLRQGTHLDTTR